MRFRVRSSAKVNLSLDILRQRPDGYHELASVVHTIGLWDEIEGTIGDANGPIEFECDVCELEGEDNLCVRAVRRFQAATGLDFGITLQLHKRIPTGAGLGGGSGNAAAVLLALNRAFDEPLDATALHELGATLGADVPLFLSGGAVLMEGIGEKLSPLHAMEGWLLLVKPSVSLSTPAVYRAWDHGALESHHSTETLLKVWNAGGGQTSVEKIAAYLGNDLERGAAQITAAPAKCVALLRECGSLGALMSGSGSSCFGLFASENAAHAAQAQLRELVAKDVLTSEARTFVAPFAPHGVWFE